MFLFLTLVHWLEPPVQCWMKGWKKTSVPCFWSSGKAFSLSPLRMTLTICFLWMIFNRRWKFHSIPSLLRVFIRYWILDLSKVFTVSIEMIVCYNFLKFKNKVSYTGWFLSVKPAQLYLINSTWSWYYYTFYILLGIACWNF